MNTNSLALGKTLSRLPLLRSDESIRAVVSKYPDKVSMEDAASAINLKEREKSDVPPKEVRLDALLEIGGVYQDPLVESIRKLKSQSDAVILELERKYGKELNGDLSLLSEYKDVDLDLLGDLQKSVIS